MPYIYARLKQSPKLVHESQQDSIKSYGTCAIALKPRNDKAMKYELINRKRAIYKIDKTIKGFICAESERKVPWLWDKSVDTEKVIDY